MKNIETVATVLAITCIVFLSALLYTKSAPAVASGEIDEVEPATDAEMASEQDRMMMAAWRLNERAREAYENGRVAGFGLSYPWSSSGIRYPPEWSEEISRAMDSTETGRFLARFGAMIDAGRIEESVDLGESMSAPIEATPSNSGTHWYQDKDQEWTAGEASGTGCPCTSRAGKWISDVDGKECS